ncbi:YmaF family protein [Clostridium nigeriense]|uniref:YmaF family protein n=1 Tax=Clostridium nigeriense TaxID=1805470 RepID=UPI003D334A99
MKYCESEQKHVHEFVGSVKLAELNSDDVHNHRFAGVTGEAVPCKGSHIHRILTRTDFFNDHFHIIDVFTGPAIPVGNGRHVHFVYACTKERDGHKHMFRIATLIENPIGENDHC